MTKMTENHRGNGEHQFAYGNVSTRTEPKFGTGTVCLARVDDNGKRWTLFLTPDEAERMVEALDALLAYTTEGSTSD